MIKAVQAIVLATSVIGSSATLAGLLQGKRSDFPRSRPAAVDPALATAAPERGLEPAPILKPGPDVEDVSDIDDRPTDVPEDVREDPEPKDDWQPRDEEPEDDEPKDDDQFPKVVVTPPVDEEPVQLLPKVEAKPGKLVANDTLPVEKMDSYEIKLQEGQTREFCAHGGGKLALRVLGTCGKITAVSDATNRWPKVIFTAEETTTYVVQVINRDTTEVHYDLRMQ